MKKIIGVWTKRFYYQFVTNQITKKKSERTSGLTF
jgi:hypothetical protein